MHENEISGVVVDAALSIHRELGPGLVESVYEAVLACELQSRGIEVERQKPIPICYKGITFSDPFRLDLLVGGKVVVELKSVEEVRPVYFRQLVTYLKLSRAKVGLLINFNVPLLRDGIHRMVNGLDGQVHPK